MNEIKARLQDHFNQVDAPLVERTKEHAVLCGADDWLEIASWGQEKREWLQQCIALANGIPVFNRIAADQFQAAFLSWVQAAVAVSEGQVVATVARPAIYRVSAWATTNYLTLAQRKGTTSRMYFAGWRPAPSKLLVKTGSP